MDTKNQKVQLVFKRMLETRFADPVTAIDISLRHVCYGSAMGRLAIYDIMQEKDVVISDSQPQLIRGVSTRPYLKNFESWQTSYVHNSKIQFASQTDDDHN